MGHSFLEILAKILQKLMKTENLTNLIAFNVFIKKIFEHLRYFFKY